MSERRYTEEEVATIFERASQTEPASLPASAEGKGVTLSALQEIGREVGISPDAIAQAARSMDIGGLPVARKFLGFSIGLKRKVELDRPLTDADWERLVADLRDTFESRGAVRYDGPFRQWTNGNLQALVEPTPTGHRLRLQTTNGGARALMTAGMGAIAAAGATWLALVLGGAGDSRSAVGVTFMAVAGAAMFAWGALRLPSWARRREQQFEAIAARAASSP